MGRMQLIISSVLVVVATISIQPAVASSGDNLVLMASAPLHNLQSEYYYTEWACFLPQHNIVSASSSNGTLHRQTCCDEIMSAIRQACPSEEYSASITSFCHDNIAQVPSIPTGFASSTSSTRASNYSLLVPNNSKYACDEIKNTMVWSASSQPESEDSRGRWINLSNMEGVTNYYFPWRIDSTMMLRPDNLPVQSMSEVTLASQLSQSGGMHRTLSHEVEIAMLRNKDGNMWETSLTGAIYVPDAMFIDLDDPQEGMATTDNPSDDIIVTYHAAEIIDIEQPAFASPPHVVLVHIVARGKFASGNNDSATSLTKRLQFNTNVHFRYPKPVHDGTTMWVDVLLHPPHIISGQLQIYNKDEESNIGEGQQTILLKQKDSFREPLVTYVAAGNGSDYSVVAALTFASAFLGSLVMMKDIARICQWNF